MSIRYRKLTALAVMAGLTLGASAAHAALYDFETLSAGTISGQDNWNIAPGGFNGGTVTTGIGTNTSVVGAGNFNTGVSRINNGNFSYSVNFSDTSFGFEIDRRWGGDNYFTVGHDNGGGGTPGTIEWNAAEEPGFMYAGSNIQVQPSSLSGTYIASGTLPASLNTGDWVRVSYTVDFTAGANGTMSVYYKNLTDGETIFSPVPNLQNIALGSTWSTWRTNVLATPANAGLLFLDFSSSTASQLDNIYIGHSTIPEPASLVLLALGGSMLLRRRSA